jgi:signal transduction histidine kinase
MHRLKRGSLGSGPRASIKVRVLTIALLPSIVLVGAGVGINAYLLAGALKQRDTATLLSAGYNMAVPFMPALSEERRASIEMAAVPSPQHSADLVHARHGMDQLLAQFGSISAQVADAMPPAAKTAIGRFVGTLPGIYAIRQQVDNGSASRLQVYATYNQVADTMIIAAGAIGRDSTDRDVALQRSLASDLLRTSDWLDRSNSLAAAAYDAGGLTPPEVDEYDTLTRGYRTELTAIEPVLPAAEARKLDQLRASADWNDLATVEASLVRQSFDTDRFGTTPPLPVPEDHWQTIARSSATALSTMAMGDLGVAAAAMEQQSADDALTRSTIIAVASLLLAIAVVVVAVRMGNDLVRRLRGLRADAQRADSRLPEVMDRIRRGEQVDADAEVPELDYGGDEVGEVATTFSKAQHSAVLAAVQEARLREGTNVVFLNIARRSQALVERQLQVLDQAQRAADDPDQVSLLFQLDHLSTRERRNAENLIILGGGDLTRQWNTSVRLIDLVRGAVAETEQYQRVTFKRVPGMLIAGHAVADLVHLLAELVDNAIEFSRRESRIEVSSNAVAHGVVVEIEDQGIGIPSVEREEYNAMFRDPPDFGVMALKEDSRIGFFVVARLARRHDIKITLLESSYGGLRAVVLIPRNLITFDDSGPQPDVETSSVGWFDRIEPATQDPPPTNGAHSADDTADPNDARGADGVEVTVPDTYDWDEEQGTSGTLAVRLPDTLLHTTRFEAVPGPQQQPEPDAQTETGRLSDLVGDRTLDAPPRHGVLDDTPATSDAALRWPRPETMDGLRPPLPRRRRQAHLAPQLQHEPDELVDEDEFGTPEDDQGATAARHMMSAFQLGTETGRTDAEPWGTERG